MVLPGRDLLRLQQRRRWRLGVRGGRTLGEGTEEVEDSKRGEVTVNRTRNLGYRDSLVRVLQPLLAGNTVVTGVWMGFSGG